MRDDRILAILSLVADIELHDEIVEWMSSLDDADWNRTVAAIDRLAGLGDDRSAPAVADKDRRSALASEDTGGGGDIVLQRG